LSEQATAARGRPQPVVGPGGGHSPVGGERRRPGWSPGRVRLSGRSTSRPGPPRAHGTADSPTNAEPRSAGLLRAALVTDVGESVAVLEQPSPGRVGCHSLGRRSIVLPQSGEL